MSRALGLRNLPGREALKSEVRLGLEVSEFAQALGPEYRNKFRQLQQGSTTSFSASDVIKLTEELNRTESRLHKSRGINGTRVGGFLSRLQTFAGIGDVLIGGSQSLIASGVWCAVRVSIEVRSLHFSNLGRVQQFWSTNINRITKDDDRLLPSLRQHLLAVHAPRSIMEPTQRLRQGLSTVTGVTNISLRVFDYSGTTVQPNCYLRKQINVVINRSVYVISISKRDRSS